MSEVGQVKSGTNHTYPEFAGRSVIEGGNGRPGSQATRHSSPFPLPRMRA